MSTNSEELFFSYADYSMWNQIEFVTLGEFIYLINGFDPLGIRLHDKNISANDQIGYEQIFKDFSERKLDNFKSSWKKIMRMGRELPVQSDTQTEVRYLKDKLPHYEAVFLIQWVQSKSVQISPSYCPVKKEERRNKKFIQDYVGRAALHLNEFIKLLVKYNPGKGEKYFLIRILDAIEVQSLRAIPLPFDYRVPFEKRNFKFQTQTLIDFATRMKWIVPSELVESNHATSGSKPYLEKEHDVHPKKLTSIYTILLSMAVAKYKYDPNKVRNSATGGNAGSIKADVESLASNLGLKDKFNIKEDTVKGLLDDAVELLLQ